MANRTNTNTRNGSRKTSGHRGRQGSNVPVLRRPLHKFFILVSFLTCLAAFLMGASQVLGIVLQEASWVQYALRGFVILFCVLVILVEVEWIGRESVFLHYWMFRGIAYVFVGLLGMGENERLNSEDQSIQGYEAMTEVVEAIAWNMSGCGLLYVIMGILCLQTVLTVLREDYQNRKARAETDGSDSGDDEDVDHSMDSKDEEAEDLEAEDLEADQGSMDDSVVHDDKSAASFSNSGHPDGS